MLWFDWQIVVALLSVFAAAVMVIRRAISWMSGRTPSGCHSCPAHKANPNANGVPIVPLDTLKMSTTLLARQSGPRV
jgi:hypothetical protein